jgi:AraC-like DNA-binding protein
MTSVSLRDKDSSRRAPAAGVQRDFLSVALGSVGVMTAMATQVDPAGAYREWASRLPGAVLWRRTMPAGESGRVLPDGCMDLLWADGELLVAGPDTTAFVAVADVVTHFAGLRFAPGQAPVLLGTPAHLLRNQRVPLAEVWSGPLVRRLTDRIGSAADPCAELERIAAERLARQVPSAVDTLAPVIAATLRRGASVAHTADVVGLGERQLHRRCRDAFGYGPKMLARIFRLGRALDLARSGVPAATVAARAGYADQAHLSREVRDLAGAPLRTLL